MVFSRSRSIPCSLSISSGITPKFPVLPERLRRGGGGLGGDRWRNPLFNFGGTDFDGTGLGSSSKILPSEGCSISRDVHLLERRSKREGDGVRCCSVEWETLSWTSINICFTESLKDSTAASSSAVRARYLLRRCWKC
mmetsp:Transcript_8054/g.8014  ORF Transcript_8054/g.8014 Transcript_8054/m.8014 type:complete len:138 (+) Transcript_8054:31-444(+)